jgi:hypothetical protein
MAAQNDTEERKKLVMKMFDYAENPLKATLAHYAKVEPHVLFSDYNTEQDVIQFQNETNKKFYRTYITHIDSQEPPAIDDLFDLTLDEAEKCPKTKQAISLLHNSCMTIYGSIVASVENKQLKSIFDGVFPVFDEDRMTFTLTRVNRKKLEKDHHYNTLLQFLSKENEIKHIKSKVADEIREKIQQEKIKLIALHNAISEELVVKEQVICDEKNKNHKGFISIILEEVEGGNDIDISRLPEI